MAVTGFVHPDKLLTNSGAQPGDVLIYTKPVGIGVLTAGIKGSLTDEETRTFAEGLMMTLNKYARDIMVKYRVHACTDVTGFGMMGHLLEMAQGSEAEVHLDLSGITFIPQALELARLGVLPAGVYRNRHFAESWVEPGETELAVQDLLYDPQTSGGLMMAVHPEDAPALLEELRQDNRVPAPQLVGRVVPYQGRQANLLVLGGKHDRLHLFFRSHTLYPPGRRAGAVYHRRQCGFRTPGSWGTDGAAVRRDLDWHGGRRRGGEPGPAAGFCCDGWHSPGRPGALLPGGRGQPDRHGMRRSGNGVHPDSGGEAAG